MGKIHSQLGLGNASDIEQRLPLLAALHGTISLSISPPPLVFPSPSSFLVQSFLYSVISASLDGSVSRSQLPAANKVEQILDAFMHL